MKNSPQQLIMKALGTLVLCAGFIYLVARTPFIPQTSTVPGAIVSGGQQQALKLKNITLDTGTASHQLPTMDAINSSMPALGLFKAHYGTANPGFATQEHELPGPCTGAGRRYINQVCPQCQVMSGGPQPGQPEMLLWSGEDPDDNKAGAVSANCSSTADDGSVIVNVLQFGGGPVSLEQKRLNLALDIVPLLPGAERVAAFELGEWLTTIDSISRPDSVLNDMATALQRQGWREASHYETEDVQVFEQQRVFTNAVNALCVVSLNREGDSLQLLTIMSSQKRG